MTDSKSGLAEVLPSIFYGSEESQLPDLCLPAKGRSLIRVATEGSSLIRIAAEGSVLIRLVAEGGSLIRLATEGSVLIRVAAEGAGCFLVTLELPCSKFPEVHDFARIRGRLVPNSSKCTANPEDFANNGQNSPKCTIFLDFFANNRAKQ